MKISVIGDEDTTMGFRLAGIRDAHFVRDSREAGELLRKLAKEEGMGMIILTERYADALRAEIKALSEGKIVPIFVEIPDKKGPIAKKVDPIKELVRRAVGVEIKVG